ncbi:unnamed protein product [Tilletia laevis]|nr:hypothetical protein CF336_g5808 [Tilletia laevis]CAD6934936.1 unnamed protein product [Tilletia laevis]
MMPRRTDSGPRTPACRCLRTRAHPPPSSRRKTRSRSRNSTAYVHCRTHDDGEVNADVSHHPKFIPDMIALQFEASGPSTGAVVYSWIPWLKPVSRGVNPRHVRITGSFRLYQRPVIEREVMS